MENPCKNCKHRKPTCHDFCKDYLDWHDDLLTKKKAQAFDKFLDGLTEYFLMRETRSR